MPRKLLRWLFLGIGLGFAAANLFARAVDPPDIKWKELRGTHFVVYWVGKDDFAKEVLRKAEEYYHQIGQDLGYIRYTNFWQWENRVKIYIYPTHETFLEATGEKMWSQGVANYSSKEIRSYAWTEGFTNALLPHEITHLVFRDYVGFKGEVPLWLDEGVAQWQEPQKRAVVKQFAKYLLEKQLAFRIKDLTAMDIRKEDSPNIVQNFYIQAASLIDFLVAEYGADRFIQFCRELRDGKDLQEALRFAYPTSIRNMKEMEEKWIQYILGKK